jgi:hypothetical protein
VRCGKRFRRGEGQDVPDRREAGLRGRNLEIVAVLCGWILIMPLSAESFALRGLDKGDSVPDMEFMGITAESGKLSSFSGGKGLIVIYWATWSSRSPMILEFAEKELRRYEEHGVKLLAINADHQEMRREEIEAVKGKATEMALSDRRPLSRVPFDRPGRHSGPNRRLPRNREEEAPRKVAVPARPQAEKPRAAVLQPREDDVHLRPLPLGGP